MQQKTGKYKNITESVSLLINSGIFYQTYIPRHTGANLNELKKIPSHTKFLSVTLTHSHTHTHTHKGLNVQLDESSIGELSSL